jgi:hypothetical protein
MRGLDKKTLFGGPVESMLLPHRMTLLSTMHGLWLANLGLQTLLLAVLSGNGRWKQFPVFTGYIAFNLLEATVAYFFQHNRSVYLYVYMVGETVSVVLGVALVYEIFGRLFLPHPALRGLAKMIFRVVVVLLAVLAVTVYARSSHSSQLAMALLVVEEGARILEVGLIMFLFICSSVFGLHWRQPVFGIALGLGIYVAVKLAVVTLLPHVGSAAGPLTLAGMLCFDLCLLIWLGYTLAPERVVARAELPKRAQLEQWNQAIMELIHQ